MDPEIEQAQPGACPKCGMALEPLMVADGYSSPELTDMTRRFWVSLAFTLPVFLISMSDMLPGIHINHAVAGPLINWIQLGLATPVVVFCGWPFFQRAWTSLANHS